VRPVIARKQGESAGSGQYLLFSAEEELAIEKLRTADLDRHDAARRTRLLAALQDRLKGR
jgi:hypothetical protein